MHKKTHTAVIVDCWHEKLDDITFENKPSAFGDFINAVRKLTKRGMTPVFGLEDVGGYGRSLAVYLIDKGFKVKEVNTALSYACLLYTSPSPRD